MVVLLGFLRRAKRRFLEDIREDPYLAVVLGLALVLAGFWFWHGIPNFTTWDEHDRVLDPLVAYSAYLHYPTFGSFARGVAWGREPFGATFYVYALAVLPVVVYAVLTGQTSAFDALQFPADDYAHYAAWHHTPRWVWTWSIGLVRLTNVLFAVGSVYLTYRLGTRMRDRTTGRLAALLLTLTFGFLKLAKEGGEDMPAAFFLMLALYLLVRYVQTGERRRFLAASAAGGIAMAFKLVAAPIVLVIGLAHLLKTRTDEGSWWDSFWQWDLLTKGALIGFVTILLGFPTLVIAGRIDIVALRLFGSAGERASTAVGPTAPTWWWFTRTYISAFGLPLFLGAIAGVVASVVHLGRVRWGAASSDELALGLDSTVLVVGCLGLFLALVSTWHDFRVHHLLPTFPLIALLLAGSLVRLREWRPAIARPVIALLVLTTAAYAGVGVYGYASLPRDQATTWLDDHAPQNATMEAYYHGFVEIAVPHRLRLNPIWTDNESRIDQCPRYIQLGYKELLYLQDIPNDQRGYDIDSNVDNRSAYVRSLVNGTYNYTIVAEFGHRPPNFVPHRPTPGSLRELIPLGINPQSDQYGDEQELAADQYVAILERNGTCDPSRDPPW